MFEIDMKGLQLFSSSFSSILFMIGTLPMVVKAFKTRDLRSYSLGNILLSNLSNFIYWIYQAGLPFGPAWFLHGFNTVTTLLMLILYLRHENVCTPSNLPKCFSKPTVICTDSGAV
jgi:uncharacterized protein with PQ loop repeat